jgi:hypothetical protein
MKEVMDAQLTHRFSTLSTQCSVAVVVIGLLLFTQLLHPLLAQTPRGADSGPSHVPDGGGWFGYPQWQNDPDFSKEKERFLKDCRKRFDDLWKHFGTAEQQRRRLAQPCLTPEQLRQVQKDYRKHLKKVASSASGLRSRMIPLLGGLENKKDLGWTGTATGEGRQPFKDEMEFIRKYIREAEVRFDGRQSQVFYVGQENILVCLYWVEQMAKRVRNDLEG